MFDFAKRIWREVRRLFDYTTLKTALGRELTLSQSMVEALEGTVVCGPGGVASD